MTYEELVNETKKFYENANAGAIKEHLAIQFNVTGEGEGAFYIEVSEGKIDVQPYEYFDRDAIITIPSDVLVSILNKKTDFNKAYKNNAYSIDGNADAAALLGSIKKARSTTKKAADAAKAVKEAAPKAVKAAKEAAPKAAEAVKEAAPKAVKAVKKAASKKNAQ